MPTQNVPPHPDWMDLVAKDIMETKVVSVPATAPLSELERLLAAHRISGMPVTDASGRAIGVVSFRDLLDHSVKRRARRAAAEGGYFDEAAGRLGDAEPAAPQTTASREATVADLMTPVLVDVTTDAPMREICETMARHAVHRVLVSEVGTGRMVGILTSLGVLSAIARSFGSAPRTAPRRKQG